MDEEVDSSSVGMYLRGQLRRLRADKGMTQRDLGKVLGFSHQHIGNVEQGRRGWTAEFAKAVDDYFETGGLLSELWRHAGREKLPDWFRDYADLERKASRITTFETQVVNGLVQTEAYARAVLANEERVDELVAARLERQRILEFRNGPVLWVIHDEAVLRRPIGGAEDHAEQLRVMAKAAENHRIWFQVLPYTAGEHPLLNGSVTVLSFPDRPEILWAEGHFIGQVVTDTETVQDAVLSLDQVKAKALSPADSLALISRIAEDFGR